MELGLGLGVRVGERHQVQGLLPLIRHRRGETLGDVSQHLVAGMHLRGRGVRGRERGWEGVRGLERRWEGVGGWGVMQCDAVAQPLVLCP